jgi:hypothetical protein
MYFARFEVTGMMRGGKRFKPLRFSSFTAASMINLYSGSIWGVSEDGKRKLLRNTPNQTQSTYKLSFHQISD